METALAKSSIIGKKGAVPQSLSVAPILKVQTVAQFLDEFEVRGIADCHTIAAMDGARRNEWIN
jgi:hypothetical protein